MEVGEVFYPAREGFVFSDLTSHKVGAELCGLTCCLGRLWSGGGGFLPYNPPPL